MAAETRSEPCLKIIWQTVLVRGVVIVTIALVCIVTVCAALILGPIVAITLTSAIGVTKTIFALGLIALFSTIALCTVIAGVCYKFAEIVLLQ